MDPIFSNKLRFPSFYRTVPDESSQLEGISQLLKQFSWSWVGIIVPETDNGERTLRQLMTLITEGGGCVEFFHMLPVKLSAPNTDDEMIILPASSIKKSTAQVIILSGSGMEMIKLVYLCLLDHVPPKVWIVLGDVDIENLVIFPDAWKTLNKIITFTLKKGEIIGFKDILHSVNTARFIKDGPWELQWDRLFQCVSAGRGNRSVFNDAFCSENETLQGVDVPDYDVVNFRHTFSVYTAVYALAHALHEMLESTSKEGKAGAAGSLRQDLKPWKVRDLANTCNAICDSFHNNTEPLAINF